MTPYPYNLILAAVAIVCCGADWLQFRGNDSTGASVETSVPTSWGRADARDHVAWRADLPGRGVSSPIVVAGNVIVTASSGHKQDRLHLICFHAATGELNWQRQFWATGRTLCHPTMAVAAPTPASDGKRIFAFFSSNDGELVGEHDFGEAILGSPAVADGAVYFRSDGHLWKIGGE